MKKILAAGLLLTAMSNVTLASTEAVNTNTISPTLQVNVTVQKAIRLTLATGSQCAISSPGSGGQDYSISFGNVDALAINAATCGAKYAAATPGVTAAVYYSDYNITPLFTNQNATTNTITSYVSTNFATLSNVLNVVQANSAPTGVADLTNMSTNAGAPTNVATNAASGTAITRYVGVSIAPTNSSLVPVNGSDSATVTYTMTIN